MKKATSIFLLFTLLVTFLVGCNNSVSIQSNFSDDVIIEEIIIDDTSSNSDALTSNTETPSESFGYNSSTDNSSIDDSSADNSFVNDSSADNSSIDNSSTDNSSADNSLVDNPTQNPSSNLVDSNNSVSTPSNFSDDAIIDDASSGSDVLTSNTETSGESFEDNSSADNSSIDNPSQNTSSVIDSTNCLHSYDEGKIEQTAEFFNAGTKKYTCTKCGDSYTNTYPVEKMKILSIGNSFSLNSMWKLYDICKAAGVKEIDIAIMYIGGCSLDKHWENAHNNSSEYQLYRNNSGEWKITENYTLEKILQEKDWDIITLQNKSEYAADKTKFSNLENMVDYVSNKCPDATLLWHMTWAFTKDSQYLSADYQSNDVLMYQKITECAQEFVEPNSKIRGIVPVGTAIMNARTSSLKKNVHQEDGSHLSEEVGYYVGAVTWYMYLTGQSPYDFNYSIITPSINKNIPMFVETAENAIKTPYQITNSRF